MQRGVGAWCRDLVIHVHVCVRARVKWIQASRVYKLFSLRALFH